LRKTSFLAWLDRLPPIRLPVGPAIPWRYGLPGAVVLLVVWALLLARPTSQRPEPATSPRALAVATGESLFGGERSQIAPSASGSVGVAEPPGSAVDVFDLGLKLFFVLALAYGSLALLKRASQGGWAPRGGLPTPDALRVLTTLTLAPNRTVHVVRAPGGRTLLLGATPSQVNLIADLGDVPEVDPGVQSGGTFLELLASKLPRA
jgi:flagellar biogenesis protein FliO